MPDRLSRIAAESKALLLRIAELRAAIAAPKPPLEILAKLNDVDAQAKTIDQIANAPQP